MLLTRPARRSCIVANDEQIDWVTEYKVAIGEQLALERKAAGLNQTHIAEQLGVSRRTVSDIERGLNPNMDNFTNYCLLLGVDFALIVARARLAIKARNLGVEELP